jgi:hypothetical protein
MDAQQRRASELWPRLWPGAEIEAGPGVVSRYEEAPDLPGPVQAVGPAEGPVTTAWCPQCQEVITGASRDDIAAYSPITAQAPTANLWPGYKTVAALITVKPCGHAFRVTDGQTILEVREPAA